MAVPENSVQLRYRAIDDSSKIKTDTRRFHAVKRDPRDERNKVTAFINLCRIAGGSLPTRDKSSNEFVTSRAGYRGIVNRRISTIHEDCSIRGRSPLLRQQRRRQPVCRQL